MIPFNYPDDPRLDAAILELGEALHRRMQGEVPSVFDKGYWQGQLLEWAMQDRAFKLDLFRFVDVLPVLRTRQQTVQHVREYLLKEGRALPGVVNIALKAAWGGVTAGLASRTLRRHVEDMAKRFIAATTPEDALRVFRKLHQEGMGFSADLLGEATVSDAEVAVYRDRYWNLIETVSGAVSGWEEDVVIDRNHLGLMQEEFFGPVLTLMRVADFETALDVAISTEFALTGGVYSRHPGHLKMAKERFRVGNLYLNRECTGAMVDRQPFGGFGMSGIGTKAGGPGYLLNFSELRSVCENTIRRGFSPDIEM